MVVYSSMRNLGAHSGHGPMSKKKSQKPKEDAADPGPEEGEAPPKKNPPLFALAGGAGLFLAAAAGAFFLAPVGKTGAPAEDAEAGSAAQDPKAKVAHGEVDHGKTQKTDKKTADKKHAEAKGHGGKEGDKTSAEGTSFGTFTTAGDTAFYLPEPLVISLDPSSGAKHLKVTLAIETAPENGEIFAEDAFRLRDVLTTYLRAVDVEALRNPGYMSALREQLKRRVDHVIAPAEAGEVLILDFILT